MQLNAAFIQHRKAFFHMSANGHHLDYLDGIRGGSALWVLLAHCMIWGGWHWFIPSPKIAVDVFMLMSGFLMNYHYLMRSKGNSDSSSKQAFAFYVRRFFRIAPCYYLSLLTSFYIFGADRIKSLSVLRAASPERWSGDVIYDPKWIDLSFGNFLNHITFVFGLMPRYVHSSGLPDWSIGLEMQFYLLFPLLFLTLRRRNYFTVVFMLTFVSILLHVIFKRLPGPYPGVLGLFPEPSFFFLKSSLFIIGIMLCDSIYRTDLTIGRRHLLAIASMGVAAIQMWYSKYNVVIVFISFLVLLINSDAQKSWFIRKTDFVLGNRLTKFMADTSYSVYLFHGFAISELGAYLFSRPDFLALRSPFRVAILTFGVLCLTYSFAFIVHKFVEVPFIRLGRSLVKQIDRSWPSLSLGN
jgi:peptidoglycan/LPS O-acetylase OafA/YrhL